MEKIRRWSYSTTLPGSAEWQAVGQTFDDPQHAADAAMRWMLMALEHGHFIAIRIEKIDEIGI